MNNPKGLNDYIENNELHVVALVTADQVLESFSPSGSEYDSVDDIWGAKRFHVAMRLDIDEEEALRDAGLAINFTYPVKGAVDGQNGNDNDVLVRLDEALRTAAPIENHEDLSQVLAEMERLLTHEARNALVVELENGEVVNVYGDQPADLRIVKTTPEGTFVRDDIREVIVPENNPISAYIDMLDSDETDA